MTAFRNNLVIALAVALGLMVTTVPARASLLAPGGTVTPPSSADASGAILADTGLLAFSFGGPISSGTVREIVVADTLNPLGSGDLTFIYQVKVSTGDVARISGSSYAGFVVDVSDFAAHSPFITTGTATPSSADRSAGGDVVGFNFATTIVPDSGTTDTSLALLIRTNAHNFIPGSIGLIDGGGQTLSGFAPVAIPEPASLVLFGLGAAAILGYGRKRRKVTAS